MIKKPGSRLTINVGLLLIVQCDCQVCAGLEVATSTYEDFTKQAGPGMKITVGSRYNDIVIVIQCHNHHNIVLSLTLYY